MYRRTTLPNGLRLVTATMPHTRSVSIGFYIRVGSRYEPDAEAGISHFTEHLLFKGTEKRPSSRDISEAIEGVGGILNGGTDKELTAYWCKVARPHFDRALDVLVDMLRRSRFVPNDIEKERQVVVEEIKMSMDSPSQRVDTLIDRLLWPAQPLGRDIAGTENSVGGIARDSMLDFVGRHYQPQNTVVAIAGDIQHEQILDTIGRAIGDWPRGGKTPTFVPCDEQVNPRLLIEKRDTEQAHLCLALPGLPLMHPQRFVLDMMNIVLGEGMSSRLFTEIRDKLALAYHVHSYVDYFSDCGGITVYAGVDPKKLAFAVEAILAELGRMKQVVPEAELTKAKELSKGRILLRMEDSRAVAGWLGGQETFCGRVLTVDEIVAIIDAITAAQVADLASKLLVGEKLRLAVVGPLSPDEPLDRLLKL